MSEKEETVEEATEELLSFFKRYFDLVKEHFAACRQGKEFSGFANCEANKKGGVFVFEFTYGTSKDSRGDNVTALRRYDIMCLTMNLEDEEVHEWHKKLTDQYVDFR